MISFLSCEKDTELIVRKLFFESGEISDMLKRLLVITAKDCLDESNTEYQKIVDSVSISKLWEGHYISNVPKLRMYENEELQSYIIIGFDNFSLNINNPQYRDNTISFDVICPTDCWDIGDYKLRPLKIVGCIDKILNNKKLTGIGTVQFLSCNELILDENFSGYTLTYSVIHGGDDRLR